jgi:hypothetical protein
MNIKARNEKIIDALKTTDKTYKDIGEEFGLTRERVRQIRVEAGLPDRGPAKGANHPQWKGKERDIDGVPHVYAPNHERADKEGFVPEKVLVAEDILERHLQEDEYVIVLNGDEQELNSENIAVVDKKRWEATRKKRARHYSKQKLLHLLRWLALQLGHTPRLKDVNELTSASHMVFYNYFGTMTEAQKLAGLTPNKKGWRGVRPITEEFTEQWGWLVERFDSPEEILSSDEDGTTNRLRR